MTLFSFNSSTDVAALSNRTNFSVRYSKYNFSLSFWTTEWTVPHSRCMDDYVIISEIPQELTEDDLKKRDALERDVKRDESVDVQRSQFGRGSAEKQKRCKHSATKKMST